MKKSVISLVLILTLAFVFVGCSNSVNEDVVIDIDALSNEVMDVADFKDMLVELDETTLTNIYGSLQLKDVVKFKVYNCSSNAKAEELALFEAVDEEAANRVLNSVNERIEDLKFGFEGYLPEEVKIIENAVVKKAGKYVLFAVGENYEKIGEVFNEYLK